MPAAALFVALAVAALSGVYAGALYAVLGRGLRGSERLGFALILGPLTLATANNFLTAALGSRAAGVVVIGVPVAALGWQIARGRWRDALNDLRPTLLQDAIAAAACLVALTALSYHLVASTTAINGLHPDLPWHVGRAAQQAFLGTAWSWPLSPLAFPSALPFVSFAADALVSAALRSVPAHVDGMQYVQALWCWSIVMWIGASLVAGRGAIGALVLIAIGCLVVPGVLWGADRIALIVFVFFYANPNSALAWPIGLALAIYLHRCFRDRRAPSAAVVVLVPAAGLFVKANQAPSFAFLQAAAIALWLRERGLRDTTRLVATAAVAWAAAIGATVVMGAWPPGRGVHPSLANLQHYAGVALNVPATWRQGGANLAAFSALVIAIHAIAVRGRRSADEWIPVATFAMSIAYVAAAWLSVVPNDLAEGEPMHVNFELIMWIGTALLFDGVWRWPAGATARAPLVAAGAWCAWAVWTVNSTVPQSLKDLAPYTGATRSTIDAIRARMSPTVGGGTCFAYGRRFVVDVPGSDDPDHVIAATGCPVLNGRRWRGYLGDNRPGELRQQAAIAVPGGKRFAIVQLLSN